MFLPRSVFLFNLFYKDDPFGPLPKRTGMAQG